MNRGVTGRVSEVHLGRLTLSLDLIGCSYESRMEEDEEMQGDVRRPLGRSLSFLSL